MNRTAAANGPAPPAIRSPIDQGAILRSLGLDTQTPQGQAVILTCERYGLDPLLRHMVLIEDRPFITRDGLLHVAHASGQFDGMDAKVIGETETHWLAHAIVYRKDMSHPFSFDGRFPKLRSVWTGPQGNRRKVQENHPYGPEMAIKCAESMALRRAFDVAMGSAEEVWDRDEAVIVEAAPSPRPSATDATTGRQWPATDALRLEAQQVNDRPDPSPAADDRKRLNFAGRNELQAVINEYEADWSAFCVTNKLPHERLVADAWQAFNGLVTLWIEGNPAIAADVTVMSDGKHVRKRGLMADKIGATFQHDPEATKQDMMDYLDRKWDECASKLGFVKPAAEPAEAGKET